MHPHARTHARTTRTRGCECARMHAHTHSRTTRTRGGECTGTPARTHARGCKRPPARTHARLAREGANARACTHAQTHAQTTRTRGGECTRMHARTHARTHAFPTRTRMGKCTRTHARSGRPARIQAVAAWWEIRRQMRARSLAGAGARPPPHMHAPCAHIRRLGPSQGGWWSPLPSSLSVTAAPALPSEGCQQHRSRQALACTRGGARCRGMSGGGT